MADTLTAGAAPPSLTNRVLARQRQSRRRNLSGWVALWVVAALVPVVAGNPSDLTRYEDICFALLAVLGLNMIFGYGGEVSLGQPVIVGASAYAAGVLSTAAGWSAMATLPASLVTGVVVSIVLNLVSFRLKGWYLAATTFFAVTVFPNLISLFATWTEGTNGLGNIPPIPGMDLGITGNSIRQYELALAVALLAFLGTLNLLSSRWSSLLQGLRDCHNGLTACGGNQSSVRFSLAVVSAVPVALAGWMTAHMSGFLVPSEFGLNQLLLFAGAVIIGGRGTLWGPVIGTLIFEGISLWIGAFSVVNNLVLGCAVLVISATFPVGLVGAWGQLRPWVLRRLGRPVAGGPPAEPSRFDLEEVEGPPAALAAVVGATELDRPVAAADDGAAVTNGDRAARRTIDPLAVGGDLAPTAPVGSVIFSAKGITRSFGVMRALDGVDLELMAGRITGLVGPNGSGKTTLLNVVTGFVSPDEGQIVLGDRDVTGRPAFHIARDGVRRSFQTPQLVGTLSLYDNLVLGITAGQPQRVLSSLFRGPGYRRRSREIDAVVTSVCDLMGFTSAEIATPVDELSLGLRRIVEIGRALVARPQVVCLDEPAAGLGDEELAALEVVLRRLAELRFAVLLIEHNLEFVGKVSHQVVSLDLGRVDGVTELRALDGTPNPAVGALTRGFTQAAGKVIRGSFANSVSADAEVMAHHELPGPDRPPRPLPVGATPAIEVTGLSSWYGEAQALFDVSLTVAPGEIVGILGDNGAGKSTLLQSIARVHRKVRGGLSFEGHQLNGMIPSAVSLLGLGLVREGAIVFSDLTITDHLKMAERLCEQRGKGWRGEAAVFDWLPILGQKAHTKAGLLSGGQRQLLALAFAATSGPSCLLLDEPSAGLSESVLETVFDFIRQIAAEGTTLVIAEQSQRWLVDLVDRTHWLEVGHLDHPPARAAAPAEPDLLPTAAPTAASAD